MPRLRPLIALLLNLAFLQTIVLGGGSDCAMSAPRETHAAGAAATAQHRAGAPHHAHPATHGAARGAGSGGRTAAGPERPQMTSPAPSQPPHTPAGCSLMATCSTPAVRALAVELPPSFSHATLPTRPDLSDEPHSVTRTVEPPPPRA